MTTRIMDALVDYWYSDKKTRVHTASFIVDDRVSTEDQGAFRYLSCESPMEYQVEPFNSHLDIGYFPFDRTLSFFEGGDGYVATAEYSVDDIKNKPGTREKIVRLLNKAITTIVSKSGTLPDLLLINDFNLKVDPFAIQPSTYESTYELHLTIDDKTIVSRHSTEDHYVDVSQLIEGMLRESYNRRQIALEFLN